MRQIELREVEIIQLLARVAGVQFILPTHQLVWVVNPEMKSIRADYCQKDVRVYSVASCEFSDEDGVSIIATLLLTEDRRFGELDFWKVNDEPLIRLPSPDGTFKPAGG
ncbi:DUF6984 family protein [Achromobacter marplatensis]|uniref:DUF6984 family protein n=1 Tax=Achromobacter marplatensis TaxID=470868 RepID=UPI001178A126|nr:hypothetical protein [Achromobacter marplatensis]